MRSCRIKGELLHLHNGEQSCKADGNLPWQAEKVACCCYRDFWHHQRCGVGLHPQERADAVGPGEGLFFTCLSDHHIILRNLQLKSVLNGTAGDGFMARREADKGQVMLTSLRLPYIKCHRRCCIDC